MNRAVILCFAFTVSTIVQAQTALPRDANGWTILTPSAQSRIVYVSSSGSDATGKYYSIADQEIGSNPFAPAGSILAYATIAAAFTQTRAEQPDWILIKRGDTLYESLRIRNGLSADQPFVAASYGSSAQRPLLKTGAAPGVDVCCKDNHYMAIVGISFYAHTRDFGSADFDSSAGSTGFNFYTGDTYRGHGILIEDCSFRFYTNNVVQGPGTIDDILIRRNQIFDDYSSNSHSQGMYTNNASLRLEENIFDHNGWYMQQVGTGSEQDSGQATMFNHNTYFSAAHGVIFRGNMFLRASSIGNKWTANGGPATARDITIENNLYVDGEIGISIGGNEADSAWRFKNIRIADNVMLDMGRSQPTNRTLGWYLEVNDWDQGTIANNLFLHLVSTVVSNVYAIHLVGESRDVAITGNIFHNLRTNGNLVTLDDGATMQRISLSDNDLQCPNLNVTLVQASGSLSPFSFSSNAYFSGRPAGEWFLNSGARLGFSQWIAANGETGSTAEQVTYPDPNRTIETYQASLGGTATIDAFISEARKQSKATWRTEYTASAVNDWIRAGFGKTATTRYAFPSIKRARASAAGKPARIYTITGRCAGICQSGRTRQLSCGVYLIDGARFIVHAGNLGR